MNDLDHARHLLKLAQRDLKALTGMGDTDIFDDAIFGFLVQQSMEKGLKAWLSAMSIPYPKTHDLRPLLLLLEEHGRKVDPLWDMLEFNPYAVQFRYDWPPDDSPLDRTWIIQRITEALELVTSQIDTPQP